jgi:thiol-disulfide isomerase/thioredoxin
VKARSLLNLLGACVAGVTAAAAPINDNFADAAALAGSSVIKTGSNAGATAEFNEPDHDGWGAYASVWFQWTAAENGFVTVSTAGSSFDTILDAFTGSDLSGLQLVTSNDDQDDSIVTSRIRFVATAGTTYYFAIDSYSDETGSYRLTLTEQTGVSAPANDNFANALAVTGPAVDVLQNNFFATTEPGELTPAPNWGASVWFVWDAPTSERYLFSTVGSDFDTLLSVYTGSTLVSSNDDGGGSDHSSALHFKTEAGRRYYISVQGYKAAMGTVSLHISKEPYVRAPAFHLTDMNGQAVNLADLAGKVIMLDFWATWCGPCVSEIPDFINMQNEYGPDGFVIIGVSSDAGGWNDVVPFVNANGVNYTQTLETSRIATDYGPIEFIPTTYIINREGMIEERLVGSRPRAAFDAILKPLIYPTVAVSLQAVRDGNELILTWPTAASGYTLETSADFSAPTNWAPLTIDIAVIGANNVVRAPMDGGNKWFRLAHN